MIDKEELKSVNKRPAMFHTKGEGFQLVWECEVFRESSVLYDETDREYS